MLIKELIREIRIRCEMTQTQLSKETGINQTSLSKFEKGKSMPGLVSLAKLIRVANKRAKMKVSVSDIIE